MRMAASRGTHPGQAICLRLLATEEGLTQRDLAQRMDLSRPTVSKMLHAMERGGVVARTPDPADRRLTRVVLTPHGRRLERALRGVAADYVKQTFGALPAADCEELVRLLDGLAGKVRAYDPPADRAAGESSKRRGTRRRPHEDSPA